MEGVGTMSMNGQDRPIAGEAGGPLFGDAAGAYHELGRLPLAKATPLLTGISTFRSRRSN